MSVIKPNSAVGMTSPPSGYYMLIDRHSVSVCGHSIKALAMSVVITNQPVPQLINDETLLPHCKHIMLDTFWVLFLTNLLKQDPACPGACVHSPGAKTVVVLGTLAWGQFVGGKQDGE